MKILALSLFLLPLALINWPVDRLEIIIPGENDRIFAGVPSLLGRDVQNTIIHSVQLTPVIDTYRVQEGRIFAWREAIMSHNAGLPSLKPERGRFVYDSPWMIVEGGGASWSEIRYRVGTEQLGKNKICIFNRDCQDLWREVPGKLLVFRVSPGNL
ncbi:hypothetical protein FACS1894206_07290 [Deltaproteobacteria bacterium]|nr:hypothetical protein FACS1894206_07290 [Deltaproteobacteria bacterium]